MIAGETCDSFIFDEQPGDLFGKADARSDNERRAFPGDKDMVPEQNAINEIDEASGEQNAKQKLRASAESIFFRRCFDCEDEKK